MGRRADVARGGRRRPCPDVSDQLGPLILACEDYLVGGSDGRVIGVVDRVETVGEPPVPSGLVVTAGWFGRRRLWVDVGAVETVLPAERRIVVDESKVASVPRGGRA